jgi:hypothetical protein
MAAPNHVDKQDLRVSTGSLEGLEKLDVDGNKLAQQRDGLNRVTTLSLSEVQEGNGTEEDGAGNDTSFLSLEELADGLSILCEGESLRVAERGLCVVVVAVEPFHHLHGGDIDTGTLATTGHGEVLVEDVEVLGSIALRGSLIENRK